MAFYRPLAAAPTKEQLARIGQIITEWAILDNITQMILSKLAYAPWWPTGALTDNLGFENRLMALKHLTEIHDVQLGYTVISENLCAEIDDFRKSLAANRAIRNKLAHWVIHRVDDDTLLAARLATRPANDKRQDTITLTVKELDAHIEAIQDIIGRGLDLFDLLPTVPDPFHRK